MIEFYKLIFDMTLIYELFGFYFKVIFHVRPSVGGFLLLVSAVLLDVFLRSRDARRGIWKFLPLALPLAIFYYRPSVWQLVQFVPIWAFIGASIWTDRVFTTYDGFKDHFAFAGKLQFIYIPSLAFWERVPGGLQVAVPYLLMMLVMGVCLMRMLREKETNSPKQAIYMAVFLVLSALLTVGGVPQMLVRGIGFVYHNVIAPLLMAAATAVTAIGYVFVMLARWLLSLRKGTGPAPGGSETPPAWYDASRQYELVDVNSDWLKYILIGIAALLAVLFIVLILRKMLGEKSGDAAEPERDERIERATEQTVKPRAVLGIRPRNPRLAVRYYYGKFLSECARRGEELPTGLTATELAAYCADRFPGVDPHALAAIYAPARYSSRESVTAADVDGAAEAWRALKRTRPEKK